MRRKATLFGHVVQRVVSRLKGRIGLAHATGTSARLVHFESCISCSSRRRWSSASIALHCKPLDTFTSPTSSFFENTRHLVPSRCHLCITPLHCTALLARRWYHACGSTKVKRLCLPSAGSFYASPLVNAPCSDPLLLQQYPAYLRPNTWPTEHLPALEPAVKAMSAIMLDTGLLLMECCDR